MNLQRTPSTAHGVILVEDDEVDALCVERLFRKTRVRNPYVILREHQALPRIRTFLELHPLSWLMLGTTTRSIGLDLLGDIRRDAGLSGLLVIVTVVDHEEILRIEGLGLEVAGYLLKPVGQAALDRELRRHDRHLDYEAEQDDAVAALGGGFVLA